MEIAGIIYLIINTGNNKYYVGQTQRKLKERIKEHKKSKFTAIGQAIHKHGWKKFTFEVLEKCVTIEELNECEKFWIAYYD